MLGVSVVRGTAVFESESIPFGRSGSSQESVAHRQGEAARRQTRMPHGELLSRCRAVHLG